MKILLTQPYVPAYRVPLFQALRRELRQCDAELIVAAGSPAGDQARRSDRAEQDWVLAMRERVLRIGSGREIRLRALPRGIRLADIDAVVTELDPTNLLAWSIRVRHPRTPLVLWGHGKSFVRRNQPLVDVARNALVHAATMTMTYTPAGREHLLRSARLAGQRVVAVGNSTDTLTLRRASESLTDEDRRTAVALVGEGPRALFVGGLDPSKRISDLLAAAGVAHADDPSFKLVVVGRGALQSLVEDAATSGAVVHVPEARGRELAAIAELCDSVWMPGRVGLVAVDALALGLPVMTTHHAFHAPELDLLRREEVNFLKSDPASFAREARDSARQGHPVRSLADLPTVEKVATTMATTILASIDRANR
ncbi:glycosyltransferase [Curtobacterium sp. MCBD17_040]|uniref:glycosyltransferase n=1 Tax=Curtobacterium sp. MCBD17_040 TaxID=2175674 RepID=UPI000DA793D9|nr:glycosyltransferase [Curtobacterium sp. MCBD17_040]WIB64146.1 glycosyltransferase [Curtobacterium sp. MCBD17_040]